MSIANPLQTFQELHEAGIFADIFLAVAEDLARKWATAGSAEEREELWHRQRSLRDVRREFNKLAGIETNG